MEEEDRAGQRDRRLAIMSISQQHPSIGVTDNTQDMGTSHLSPPWRKPSIVSIIILHQFTRYRHRPSNLWSKSGMEGNKENPGEGRFRRWRLVKKEVIKYLLWVFLIPISKMCSVANLLNSLVVYIRELRSRLYSGSGRVPILGSSHSIPLSLSLPAQTGLI